MASDRGATLEINHRHRGQTNATLLPLLVGVPSLVCFVCLFVFLLGGTGQRGEWFFFALERDDVISKQQQQQQQQQQLGLFYQ
jgi:hypothetical protein